MTYALTVRQPYAAAIIAGSKTTERRSWRTSYRGRLHIHAARPGQATNLAGLPPVFGAIIGHAELTGITGQPGEWEWHT